MAYRVVSHLVHDPDGGIMLLCNNHESWSPRIAEQAIRDIESGDHTYYMNDPDDENRVIEFRVVESPGNGKVLLAVQNAPEKAGT